MPRQLFYKPVGFAPQTRAQPVLSSEKNGLRFGHAGADQYFVRAGMGWGQPTGCGNCRTAAVAQPAAA
jgi:hypothetical protein